MPVDHEHVLHLERETRFRGLEIEQVLHLKKLLKAIHEDPDLNPYFVLIGGTAINLFNPALPRLSVDIDIDFIDGDPKVFASGIIQKHIELLKRIGSSLDMRCLQSDIDKWKFELHFVYQSNFTADTSLVKLDVSYLLKTTVFTPEMRAMPQLHKDDGYGALMFRVASPAELWGGKAIAVVYNAAKDPAHRNAPRMLSSHLIRHLFDLHYLHQQIGNNPNAIDFSAMKSAFIIRAVARIADLYLLTGEGIRRCDQAELVKDLLPFLRTSAATGKPLCPSLDDMLYAARDILNRVCSGAWSAAEKQFVKRYQLEGSYEPEIIFPRATAEFKRLADNDYLKAFVQEQRKKKAPE